jgi:hypothetical protein
MSVDSELFWDQILMARFNERVTRALARAGWIAGSDRGRCDEWVAVRGLSHSLRIFPAAVAALSEFGGLRVDEAGVGIDRAREPFILDPGRAVGSEDIFVRYSEILNKALFPLGEAADQAFIAIADSGEVYLLFEGALLIGDRIDTALVNLIEGRMTNGAKWIHG